MTSPSPRFKLACVSGYFFESSKPLLPRISIIIPVLNEVDNIELAVSRSLEIADELIISDGGSTDGTLNALRHLSCTVCHSQKGRGQQLHAGAKLATGDILLFMHADNWLAPEVKLQLQKTWNATKDSGSEQLFGCFRQRIDDKRIIFRLIEMGNLWRAKYQKLPYGDQGIFVSRNLYDKVGGIPQIPLMEDFEFSRLASRHCDVTVLPGCIYVDARRWDKVGPLRQSIRNWTIAARYRMGVQPDRLMKKY